MLTLNFTPFPVLKTPRLLLRQLEPGDANDFLFLRTNEVVNKYINSQRITTIEGVQEFMAKLNNAVVNNESIFWAIAENRTNKLIGTICLWNFSLADYQAEAGYVLHPAFHGKGIMNEALSEVIRYGFESIGLQSMVAYTHKDNKASTMLLKKNKFIQMPAAEDENVTNNFLLLFQLNSAVTQL
jgi:[ribosomal protein S5]-alanine N-acetyltransferase